MSFSFGEASSDWALLILLLGFYGLSSLIAWRKRFKAPVVGSKSHFEPSLFSNYRFFKKAENVLNEGHSKVRPCSGVYSAYRL